ncbi:MAG: ABC transporter substrate-binding protein, partial [SAR324 cluster bacterium]|nr:ABC transporter substrate-binding protein [SAR324 cluster bacterium]
MKRRSILTATLVAILTAAISLAVVGTAAAQTPKRGGTLVFIVGGLPPSFDGHAEVTFTMIHPVAPNYSLLIKPDPTDPERTRMRPDIAESWQKSPDGLTYTFRIRRGVRFHDGEALTSKDLVATFDKLRAPPAGTVSRRKPFFQMIDSISTPDDYTLVFKLKYPTAAFLPVLAIPFNFIYSASKLAKDMNWYRRNVVGTGPFKFVSYATGSSWVGKRNEDYFKPGLPYLDGYEAIFSRKLIVRVQAIRSRRAFIEFRGFPPKDRDNLVKALGDEIV